MTLSGCATGKIVAEAPVHCVTKDETFRYSMVIDEKLAIFDPTNAGVATRFVAFAERVDYLESMCRGINAYRGEKNDD